MLEELRDKLESLSKKVAFKEAEILDLRNEIHTLRALFNAAIDEQIRLEEEAHALAEQNAINKATELAQKAIEEQRLKASDEARMQREEELKIQKAHRDQQEEIKKVEAEKQKQDQQKDKKELAEDMPAPARRSELDHDAIMRTIEDMSKTMSSLDKATAAEKFKEQPTLGDKVSRSKLNDIKKAIGINERFLYANELFGGDMAAFKQAVDELNHVDSEADADRLLNEELAPKYQWNGDDETVIAFKTLVSRRFV